MKIFKITINMIDIDMNTFTITSTDNIKFISDIVKGSVGFLIYNENNEEMNLCNLMNGMNVKIVGLNNKENIIIKKIYIKNNYIIHSEDSDSENIDSMSF
jgi:hypothetical protein